MRQYGYGWDEVHDEAEVLEHALSDRLLDAIDVQLGHPGHDPHGDPIPGADGSVSVPRARQLSALPAGERGRVVRISDRDPEVLRELMARGVALDSDVVAGDLPVDTAEAIWVTSGG
jgi:DtxR family Mn-dependent transcriptional regulator